MLDDAAVSSKNYSSVVSATTEKRCAPYLRIEIYRLPYPQRVRLSTFHDPADPTATHTLDHEKRVYQDVA